MRGRIVGLGGWLKNSFIDYPRTISTVLFFNGCNLRCPFCHNRTLVDSDVDLSLSSSMVWDFLEARAGKIEGVVISGGEPTLSPGLKDTLAEIKTLGYRIKLDTNGLLPGIAAAFPVDYIALDIKTEPQRYTSLLHAPYADIARRLEQSLDMVREMGDCAEVRMTVAPGLIDIGIVRSLIPMLAGIRNIVLQPMDQSVDLLDPAYNTIAPVASEDIEIMRALIAGALGACRIRGKDELGQ